MSVATGTRVARSRDGIVHVVAKSLTHGRVACLCGTIVMYPRTTRLAGLECPTCLAIERGPAA